MRLTIVLCLLTIFCASAMNSYSQKAEISLNLQNVTLGQALDAVKQQSEYSFWYRNEEINLDKRLSVHIENQHINNVLDNLLADQGVSYTIDDKHIIIYKKTGQFSNNGIKQQNKRITGVVTDGTNEAIIGANVIVKGTTLGTITDLDGRFSLDVPDNAVLQVSYIGYTTKEVAVDNQTTIHITLIEDSKTIDEVVVIGYGSVKKSNLTGAVSSIKTTELQQTPMTSIDQGLAGRASGVQVTQTSGMPGAVASIRVRGSSSLQGGNEPLYVIDGFPVYSGTGFGSTGGKVQMSGLATVNPSDIESIEILKDASATAIYGARAANGVVLVTTKSGKKGRDVVTFESSWGLQSLSKKLEVMDAQEYAALVNEAYTNDGLSPVYDLNEIAKLGKGTDWQDELFRTALTQSYQLSFSGGDEKTSYAISGGYFDQQGIIINSDFKRYSLRLNLDRQLSKTFKVGTHMSGSHTIAKSPPTDVGGRDGVVTGALKMNPIQPIYENEETGEYTQMNIPGILIPNPIATANEQIFNNATTRILGDVYAEWEFIPDFKAKVSIGTDIMYVKGNQYTPSNIYQAMGLASARVNVNRSVNWLNENILTWNKTINDIHTFNVLGGFTIQQNNVETVTAASQGFVTDALTYNNLGAASTYLQPGSTATQWSLMSYLARVNYSLYDKYLFSVNARIDGSSRFGDNNKYGFFPSGSFAWRMSEENFMESVRSVISNLKLRASYGFTGNTEIGVYESLATLGNNNWTIGNNLVTGFFPNRIPNPDLKWEKTGQMDIGLDVGFVDNRFRITADYYRKKTTDLLYNVAIPTTSGYSSMLKNIGSVENKGFELLLESDNITGAFNWTTAFNISFNRNKVLELGGEEYKEMDEGDGHLKTGAIRRLIVGEPIGVFYGYRFDGIFQNEAECAEQTSSASPIGVGLRRYKDLNGDGKVDANNDREILGDANPKFFGGLTNTFSYKGVELNVFLQYSYGNKIFNYNAMEFEAPTGGQNVYKDMVNRWTPSNPSDIYPKASTNRNLLVSDRFVEDGSYLKLKTLSLSYSFPKLKFKHIGGVRVFITGQNLLTWTKYKGYDPEVSYRGASTLEAGEDYGGYPQSRTYMFGIKLDIK